MIRAISKILNLLSLDFIIFLGILIVGAIIVYKILKGILKVALWVAAIVIVYILLRIFVLH